MAKVFQKDIEKLEQQLKLEGMSPRTIYQYMRSWERFRGFSDVFSKEVVYAYLALDNNNTGVNRAMFNRMIQVKNAGFSLPKHKKKSRKIPKQLNHHRAVSILQNIDDDYKEITRLMYETGARISEALNIKFEDIDREKGTILVTGKGDKERLLYPSSDLIESLLRRDGYSGYVFPSDRRDGPLTQQAVDKHIKKIDPNASAHMFRHTYAVRVYNASEGDLLVTKDLLGHEDVSTTSIYAKASDIRKRDAIAKARKLEYETREEN